MAQRSDLKLRYSPSRYSSDPTSLAATRCDLLAKVKTLFPGVVPRVEHLASVDAIHLVGVSKLEPEKLKELRKFGVFDYELKEDELAIFISRNQRSVCVALVVAAVYFVVGGLCLMSGAALWQ